MTKQNLDFFPKGASFLNGIGQIMLQKNSWTGLLFLAGICFGSLIMGLGAIVAVTTGTLTAMVLKYDKEEINNGLYGFSAALVGVALICFFQPTMMAWIAVVVGSALATVIQHFFIIKKIPAFTFPFILVTWFALGVVHYYPTLMTPPPGSATLYANNYLALFSHGFGQVIFQDNIWSGMLFIVGVLISRPIAAIFGLVGIVLSSLLAYQLGEPVPDIYLGLLSYNAVLCAITFAGKKAGDILMAFIAIGLSVLITIQMRHLNLPALTFPFVLGSWLTIVLKMGVERLPLKSNAT
jgi:urea transporter